MKSKASVYKVMTAFDGAGSTMMRSELLTRTCLFVFLLSCSVACSRLDGPAEPAPVQLSRIILIRPEYDSLHNILGSYRMGVWVDQKIYCSNPFRLISIDQNLNVTSDSILFLFPRFRCFSINNTGTLLLGVRSYRDASSAGALYLRDLNTGAQRVVKDSSFKISIALFYKDDRHCIYHTFGNSAQGIKAGYYTLDLDSGIDSLIFEREVLTGYWEYANGFDLSPDFKKILIPLHFTDRTPLPMEYDLESGNKETLHVAFKNQFLWLRYHLSGNTIVYSNYPHGAAGYSTVDTAEIGILNRNTLTKEVLPANPFPRDQYSGGSVSIFPTWSPDGKHIIYGSAVGPFREPLGTIGGFNLFMYTNVQQ